MCFALRVSSVLQRGGTIIGTTIRASFATTMPMDYP